MYLSWRVPWLGALQPPRGWCLVVGICQWGVSVVCKAPAGQHFCTEARSDEDFQQIAVLELTPENATPHRAAELPSIRSVAAPSDPTVRVTRTLKDISVWGVSVTESVVIQSGSKVWIFNEISQDFHMYYSLWFYLVCVLPSWSWPAVLGLKGHIRSTRIWGHCQGPLGQERLLVELVQKPTTGKSPYYLKNNTKAFHHKLTIPVEIFLSIINKISYNNSYGSNSYVVFFIFLWIVFGTKNKKTNVVDFSLLNWWRYKPIKPKLIFEATYRILSLSFETIWYEHPLNTLPAYLHINSTTAWYVKLKQQSVEIQNWIMSVCYYESYVWCSLKLCAVANLLVSLYTVHASIYVTSSKVTAYFKKPLFI